VPFFLKNGEKVHSEFNTNAQMESKHMFFEGLFHEQIAFFQKKGQNGQKVQTVWM